MERNFNDISRIGEFLRDLYRRQDDLEKKYKALEREKNQQIYNLERQINSNEVLAKCRKNNEIIERLSPKLNEAEKIVKTIQSKAIITNKTLDELNKQIQEMQEILKSKESIKESIEDTIMLYSTNIYNKKKNYYFVCPICQCRNPHIENVNIDIDLMDFNCSYYCACNILNKRPKPSELSLLLNENIPTNLCPTHSNKTLKFFCKKCKKSFCESCNKDIDDHQKYLVNYSQIMSEEDAELVKLISEKFKCEKKDIYKKIISDYFKEFKKEDEEKYHLKKNLSQHQDKISCLILLQSGFIAIGSFDATIYIWDLERLSVVKTFQDLGIVLALLEFEPGKLISASSHNTLLLWDINSNKSDNIGYFNLYDEKVNCLVKCDDNTFASISYDPYIIKWDYIRKNQLKKVKLHKDYISSLIKLNDDNLCTGSKDKFIKIWDWKQERIIKELPGHNDTITCLCKMDDEILLSGSYDKTIKVWKNYNCISTINIDTRSINVLLKINDNYFAGNCGKEIIIWNINNYSQSDKLTEHHLDVTGLIKRNNNELVSCSYDCTIKIWEKD